MVTLREYKPEDRPVLEAHIVEFQEHERKKEPEYSPGVEIAPAYVDFLLSKCENEKGKILLAEEDGQVIGYTCFCDEAKALTLKNDCLITDVYLAPAHRGRGIGRTFLEAAERFARERGHTRMSLNVLARNPEGQAMYRKCGFRDFEVTMIRDLEMP